MDLATLQSYVYNITNRSDLTNQTAQAIRKTLLALHTKDDWVQDLKLTNINSVDFIFANGGYITDGSVAPVGYLVSNDTQRISIDLSNSTVFPRLRKPRTVKEFNNPLTGSEVEYKRVEYSDVVDNYLVEKYNIWYRAGTNLVIRPYTIPSGVTVTWYQNPDVMVGFSSWIADLFPFDVASLAAAEIFKLIGKDDEAARYKQEYSDIIQRIYAAGLI